jgi:hypothetical protein
VLHWTAGDWEQATDLQRSALAAIPVDFEFGPDLFEFYKDVFHQAVWLQDWALAEQVWQRSTTWCERHPATHEQRLSQRAQTINLCVGQGRWSEAYQLAQDMAQQVAATGNRVVYCETLLWGSRIALHVDQAAAALVQAEEALSVATAEGFPTLFPLIHRTLGAAEAALERPTEARRHVTAALELTLAKGQEKHGLMGLLGGIFQLACLEQERLPRPLFERAVALAATRPHTGIVARLEAQALAQREGIDLAQEEAQARRPTDWAELELMARELLSCAMAD